MSDIDPYHALVLDVEQSLNLYRPTSSDGNRTAPRLSQGTLAACIFASLAQDQKELHHLAEPPRNNIDSEGK